VSNPDPGVPLTEAETRVWVDLADQIDGTYLGHLSPAQLEELVAGMVAQYPPDHEWAPRVADAIRERWRIQTTARVTEVWERIKRES
jgi:hypothetical protein